MKKFTGILFCFLVIAVVVGGIFYRLRPSPPPAIDYRPYGVMIFTEKNTAGIGYAAVWDETVNTVQFLTAKHIFEGEKQDYVIAFYNGTCANIKNISYPLDGSDIAIVSVERKTLQRGRDYDIPNFQADSKSDLNKKVYVYQDEVVGKNIPKTILSQKKDGKLSCLLLDGKIAPRRSGSPAFLQGTNICVGIVSGYFKKDSSKGESTLVLQYLPLEME